MGHVQRGDAEPGVQELKLGAHLDAEIGVEIGERLIHEKAGGLAHNRPAHRDPLPLSSGKRRRLAIEEALEPQGSGRGGDTLGDLGAWQTSLLESEGEVLPDGHMRIERIVLKDHGDVALARIEIGHHFAAKPDLAAGDLLETGGAAQQRRFPASRRAHEDHEFAVRDLEIHARERKRPVVKALGYVLEIERRHQPRPRERDWGNPRKGEGAFVIIVIP